ncbi:uracil-DNA glycosylase [Haloarchaeobius sp. HRN-SO-5]|uniref:uracil-DNA glycosylase n=1 Tax=Haloarchaeobius sp. HRN-SO-5 TaxID=3446118 RepID=UPI003EB976D4
MTDFETRFESELAAVPDEHVDRDRFVPGVGPFDADVMLVGEAPGETEVEEGEPFVGRAGGLLDSTLNKLGVDRASLYLTNVVKVRPPENRTPRVAEIEAWLPVLDAEIEAVDPVVVVSLGATATRALLDTDETMESVHGRRFERDGRTVVPAYHPAAYFYDRSKRAAFEADLESAFDLL